MRGRTASAGPVFRALADGSLARHEVVTPGMCGPTTLFAGRLGDWTWDAVSESCGVDAYRARDAGGEPTYLAFSYFRIRSSAELHPLMLTFGDRLHVVSRVFGEGSESVLVLHRVRRDGAAADEPVDPVRFHTPDEPGAIRVENFNRWIVRTRAGDNTDLARSAPAGFRHRHLPTVDPALSARRAVASARTRGTFLDSEPPGRTTVVDGFRSEYRVDASRDLNGVGLLYFASYFAIVDRTLLELWQHLGRGTALYGRRVVLDQRIAYVGNAGADAVLDILTTVRRRCGDPAEELVEMVVRDRCAARLLAVCSLSARVPGEQP